MSDFADNDSAEWTDTDALRLSRRGLMASGLAAGSLAALGTAPALAAPAKAAGARGSAGLTLPTSEAGQAALVRRMRFRADAGMIGWWFRGTHYAQQGARLTPICGLLLGSMIKITPRADGGFDAQSYELAFRTDLETGKRIEKLKNPITGETISIPFAPVGPTVMHFSADNVPTVPAMLGGSKFTYSQRPEQFWLAGDTVFMRYLSESVVETAGFPDRVINDFGMIYGPAREALNPRVKSASAWIQGTDVTDYARWLKMPAGSGSQTLRSIGAKVGSFAEMPADWIAMVAKADPKMAANPMSVFDRAEATYKG